MSQKYDYRKKLQFDIPASDGGIARAFDARIIRFGTFVPCQSWIFCQHSSKGDAFSLSSELTALLNHEYSFETVSLSSYETVIISKPGNHVIFLRLQKLYTPCNSLQAARFQSHREWAFHEILWELFRVVELRTSATHVGFLLKQKILSLSAYKILKYALREVMPTSKSLINSFHQRRQKWISYSFIKIFPIFIWNIDWDNSRPLNKITPHWRIVKSHSKLIELQNAYWYFFQFLGCILQRLPMCCLCYFYIFTQCISRWFDFSKIYLQKSIFKSNKKCTGINERNVHFLFETANWISPNVAEYRVESTLLPQN